MKRSVQSVRYLIAVISGSTTQEPPMQKERKENKKGFSPLCQKIATEQYVIDEYFRLFAENRHGFLSGVKRIFKCVRYTSSIYRRGGPKTRE